MDPRFNHGCQCTRSNQPGYPERRAWIHLRITDNAGQMIFESGSVDNLGNLAAQSTASFEPHHDVIRNTQEVQIYEIVPVDLQNNPTQRLIHFNGFCQITRNVRGQLKFFQFVPWIACDNHNGQGEIFFF